MAELGVAASAIAVIDLSAKVASLCFHYSIAVKGARHDITRLQNEVKNLENVVGDVQHLVEGHDGAKFPVSEKVLNAINDCSTELKILEEKLEPSKTRKAIVVLEFGL
jgi:hypothetical protein